MIIKGEKKVKNFEFDAGMDPSGGPKESRSNSDGKERKNVKKFEFDSKMGPVLIAIVKREKILKSLNLMQRRTQEGAQKGLGPTGLLKKQIILGIFSTPKKKIYLGPYCK